MPEPVVKTFMLKDVQHVIIKWVDGSITVIQKMSSEVNAMNVFSINEELLKEMRPLIGTFE